MNNRMKFLSFSLIFIGLTTAVFAQQDTIVNPNSVERIPYYEQLYRLEYGERLIFRRNKMQALSLPNLTLQNFYFRVFKVVLLLHMMTL